MDGWIRSEFEHARDQGSGWRRPLASAGVAASAPAPDRLATFAVLLVLGWIMVWEWANPQPARAALGPGKRARVPTFPPGAGVLADGPSARHEGQFS